MSDQLLAPIPVVPARLPKTPEPAAPYDRALGEMKALMLQLASGARFERLGAIVQEHLLTGGKRLRARLAFASLEGLGAPKRHQIAWAAACEILHNATLIHDDLQDGDEVRRGQLTVWARHGQAQAINAGDLMLMLPFIALEHLEVEGEIRWQLARAIARRAEETVRGQSMEMSLIQSGQLDFASYAEAAAGKTSALFVLPVHGAALLAGQTPERAQTLSDCFRDLGLLFQIQDDVLDLFGDKGRGQVGCDIREGGASALVSEHVRLHPSEASWLSAILRTPRAETTDRDVNAVLRRFKRGGALAATLDRLRELETSILNSETLESEPALHEVAAELAELCLQPIRHLLDGRSA